MSSVENKVTIFHILEKMDTGERIMNLNEKIPEALKKVLQGGLDQVKNTMDLNLFLYFLQKHRIITEYKISDSEKKVRIVLNLDLLKKIGVKILPQFHGAEPVYELEIPCLDERSVIHKILSLIIPVHKFYKWNPEQKNNSYNSEQFEKDLQATLGNLMYTDTDTDTNNLQHNNNDG